MNYGVWLSAAGMAANQYRQNVAANNLANIETVGFKHDLAILAERSVESREDAEAGGFQDAFFDQLPGGIFVTPTRHSFLPGPPIPSDRPLDAMIEGPGFFQVQTADGVRYTRDGRFAVNVDGVLVAVGDGSPVLDEGGATITVSPTGPQPLIDGRGRVLQGEGATGRIGLVEFEDPAQLRKIGANRFVASDEAVPQSSASRIVPRMLEGSTVDPINGLAEMIEISRAFEINANALRAQDQGLSRLITEVGRF